MSDASSPEQSPKVAPTEQTALMSPSRPKPVLYLRRWVTLMLFSLISFTNAMNWITFSPFASHARTFYGVESIAIDSLSTVYMMVYIPFVFLSSWLIDRAGLRVGMIVGGVLNAVGAWIRYAGTAPSTPIYAVVLIGQLICSASQTFILQVPPLIANDWFGESERSLATSIGADFNQFGVAIGFLMGAYMVHPETAAADIRLLILVQAIITSVPTVAAIIGMQDRPPTPPSLSASRKEEAPQTDFKKALKFLITSKDYIIFFFCFGAIIGVFYAISTVLPQILESVGYTSSQGGFLGFIQTLVGIAGAIGMGILCDRTHRYKELMLLVNFGVVCCFVWLVVIIAPNSYPHLAVNQSVMGIFITAALPSYLEAAAEITYPHVSEDLSAGVLIMGAQVFGIILTFGMNAMITAKLYAPSLYLCVAVTGVCFLILFLATPKYRRLEADKLSPHANHDPKTPAEIESGPGQAGATTIHPNHVQGLGNDSGNHIVPLVDNPHLEFDEPPHGHRPSTERTPLNSEISADGADHSSDHHKHHKKHHKAHHHDKNEASSHDSHKKSKHHAQEHAHHDRSAEHAPAQHDHGGDTVV